MNQNPTVDNDLQKAIDDITNSTNQDPIFADPVAAPSSVPEGDTGELAESVGPFPAPKPTPSPVQPPAKQTILEPTVDLSSTITDFSIPPVQTLSNEPIEAEATEETTTVSETPNTNNLNIHDVKTAALRDLAPLVGKMDITDSQKFHIYRDMFENLRDYTVIEPAYQAAKNIENEKERAEALLYLIESIDNM